MNRQRLNLSLDVGVLRQGKQQAAKRVLPFSRYVEQLILEDIKRDLSKKDEKG